MVEHQVIANPFGEGSVQEFRIADVVLQISKIEFGDPNAGIFKGPPTASRRNPGQNLFAHDQWIYFLAEQVKPIYLQKGFLRAKLGPPEIRLSGNPNQHLPDQIPVFVPVTPGIAYKWKGAQWSGNALLSVLHLNQLLRHETRRHRERDGHPSRPGPHSGNLRASRVSRRQSRIRSRFRRSGANGLVPNHYPGRPTSISSVS